MPKRSAAKRKPTKQAASRRKDASPLNGVVAPIEHRFQPGQSGNPHGRPKNIKELQALILETLAEELRLEGQHLTRAQVMIRTMLIKSPSDRLALLEYAFGKVKQPYSLEDNRSDSEVVREAQELFDAIRARADVDSPADAPGAGGLGGAS